MGIQFPRSADGTGMSIACKITSTVTYNKMSYIAGTTIGSRESGSWVLGNSASCSFFAADYSSACFSEKDIHSTWRNPGW